MNPRATDLLPGEIRARLETRLFGRRVYYLPETDSTNRVASELARAGESHGSLVVADHQTGGRGRRDRRWESPAGRNLLFSLILFLIVYALLGGLYVYLLVKKVRHGVEPLPGREVAA